MTDASSVHSTANLWAQSMRDGERVRFIAARYGAWTRDGSLFRGAWSFPSWFGWEVASAIPVVEEPF
jgi:transposase